MLRYWPELGPQQATLNLDVADERSVRDAIQQSVLRRTPAARWGRTADLIGACLYLASPASDFVTGAAVPVEGGYLTSDGLER
jgi:NAD(P)-dependent dehydrogenase (short-subunit alcohol dehydrogenase family)